MEINVVRRLATLMLCLFSIVTLITLTGAILNGTYELASQQTTVTVSEEKAEQYEHTETETESHETIQGWEQSVPAQEEEYIETVGVIGAPIMDCFVTTPETWTPVILGVSVIIGISAYGADKLVRKLMPRKRREKKPVEKIEATQERYFDDTVEDTLLAIEARLNTQMSDKGRNMFKELLDTAREFDAMFPAGGASHGRIGSCYLPALLEMTEKIEAAPSLSIAKSLTPYFYRACDVLREAMEGELDAYQTAAAMDMAARATAVEQMAAVHHDTDGTHSMQCQMY